MTTMTGLVAAERIKLTSIRSPWFCAAIAVLGVVGLSTLFVLTAPEGAETGGSNPFLQFGLVLTMVLAAVSVTSEYRYSTIRTTFEAAPRRGAVLAAKAAVVAAAGALVGLLASFGSWLVVWLVLPGTGALQTVDDWRAVAGAAPVFALGAVLALAVGILVRHTAAAVSLVLVWPLLVEQLVSVLPGVGEDIARWLPFIHATNVTTAGIEGLPFGPWGSLAYFAAITAGLFAVALVVLNRRDA
jgi:ABC-2 type transport system permease protein